MSLIAQKYSQHDQEYFSLVMKLKDLKDISEVLIYGESKYGYQRKLNVKHYTDIKNTVLQKQEILPTSIILSVNKEDIYKYVKNYKEDLNLVSIELPNSKIFRIVDGQHRIEGLTEAAKIDPKFLDFSLNVIILVVPNEKRVTEVEVFNDINAKAKKLQTDLTLLAKHNYRLIGYSEIEDFKELIDHIGVKVAYYLNEPEDEIDFSVWENAIKFGFNKNSSLGIIGVSAFKNAMTPIIREYISVKDLKNVMKNKEEIIKIADAHSLEIAKFINEAWKIIYSKWPKCFEMQNVNDFNEIVKIHYNTSYYLQKTTGVNALHNIFYEQIEKYGFNQEAINSFEKTIDKSKLREKDWAIGGIFAGLTSQSGFRKAENYIKES